MEKATGIWGTRRGQCHRLFGLGLFLVILVLVWGFCYFSFFPRLETKKTQEGKKKREKKKKSKLGMPNTFKTQVCLNTLQILLCLWCFFFFSFLGGYSQSCLSPSIISSSSTNPSPWLLLVLLCEHPKAGTRLGAGFSSQLAGGGRRAVLTSELSRDRETAPRPWPSSAKLPLCPSGQIQSSPSSQGSSGAAVVGLYPQTSPKDVSNIVQPLSHTLRTCYPL